jgi:butyrate kinase
MMNENHAKKIVLCLNLGSTSSEVAYQGADGVVQRRKIRHKDSDLALPIKEQQSFRTAAIMNWLESISMDLAALDAVSCRGGRLKPIPSGVYLVNDELLADSASTTLGDHASRLSVFIGRDLALHAGCPVYVVDPISVDEFDDVARVTGVKGVERHSLGHILNSRFVAKKLAVDLDLDPLISTFIVAHMGGGATISLHKNSRIIDLINDFEGALTPERAGGLATTTFLQLLDHEPRQRVERLIEGDGGFYDYFATKQFDVVDQMAREGDDQARLLIDAYLYQQKKSIGSLLAAVNLNVDGLALTGGISFSETVVNGLSECFSSLFPVRVYAGSFEVEALISGAEDALSGQCAVLHYPSGSVLPTAFAIETIGDEGVAE